MSQLFVLADATANNSANTTSAGVITTFVYFGVIILIMWFFIIRPQKKREKEILDMQNSVKVGDTVLTNGGIYGKVVDVINDLCIVEFGLNKGVRVPLQKNYIAAIKEPDMTAKKEETEEKIKEVKEEKNKKGKSKKNKTNENKENVKEIQDQIEETEIKEEN
ncbi:MAG TPA: preprotein translocase subunit YajC [Defluviitaleaceae bacterium]|nr:preprotein translocase subunit YajC [Defluviitaleaceae bacterium]